MKLEHLALSQEGPVPSAERLRKKDTGIPGDWQELGWFEWNSCYRLIHLNAWSIVSGTVWGGLRGVALLEKCDTGIGL